MITESDLKREHLIGKAVALETVATQYLADAAKLFISGDDDQAIFLRTLAKELKSTAGKFRDEIKTKNY
jgi:hypothetical protein